MADHRLELPDDNWADIRDPKKVPWGARKPYKRAMVALAEYRNERLEANPELAAKAEGPCEACGGSGEVDGAKCQGCGGSGKNSAALVSGEALELVDVMQEAAVVALVSDWSYDLPVNAESIQEIPGDAVELLVEHCEPLAGDLFANTDHSRDEDSPT